MFDERLKEARVSSGLSQKDLASKLYISQQAYAKYEHSSASPNPEVLASIANELRVSTEYLLGRTDDPFYGNMLGAYIYQRRKNDTVEEFANKCSVNPDVIVGIEKGLHFSSLKNEDSSENRFHLSTNELNSIAGYLNVSPQYLECLCHNMNPHLVNGIHIPEDDLTKDIPILSDLQFEPTLKDSSTKFVTVNKPIDFLTSQYHVSADVLALITGKNRFVTESWILDNCPPDEESYKKISDFFELPVESLKTGTLPLFTSQRVQLKSLWATGKRYPVYGKRNEFSEEDLDDFENFFADVNLSIRKPKDSQTECTLRFAGRDGSYTETHLSRGQLNAVKAVVAQFSDAPDDL